MQENAIKSVDDLINDMTMEEKAWYLTGTSSMETCKIERLGIDSIRFADGPHGTRLSKEKNCTMFPSLCCVGASWDKELVKRLGNALAAECIKHNIDLLLAPGINLKRHILCGRNFEYFSEDPILAGELGAAYINGLQMCGIGASLKHFAVNNQEQNRDCVNVELDERTLREIYLKGFEIVVKKAKPASVMCAYNKLMSVWCSENKFLLTNILRNEWKYEGFVMSDWGAVHDTCRAIRAGLDLRMPLHTNMVEDVKKGLEAGNISEGEVDIAVKRILRFATRNRPAKHAYNRHLQHQHAIEVAKAGIVLLKNNEQTLPIVSRKYHKVSVIGEFAKSPLVNGQGSAEVNTNQEFIDNPLTELTKNLQDIEVQYKEFYKKGEYSSVMLWPRLKEFHEFVEDSDAIILFVGSMESEDTERLDRRDAHFNPNYEMFIEEACNTGKKVIVVIQSGSAMIMGEWEKKVDAIVEMWLGGEGAGTAIAEILSGKANPEGKLPETFPKVMRQDLEYPGDEVRVRYKEGLDVGYRYYDKHPEEICYPFGHGLSYTEFEYSELQVVRGEEDLKILINLKNIGKYDGSEVVQIYLSDIEATYSRPLKELKDFQKVFIQRGESKTLSFTIPIKALSYYNPLLQKWIVENGEYDILVGASSRDIRLCYRIHIDGQMSYTLEQSGRSMIG